VLKLMFAALIRADKMTEFERGQLKAIRDEPDHAFAGQTAPAAGTTVTTCPFIQEEPDLTLACTLIEFEIRQWADWSHRVLRQLACGCCSKPV